MIVLGLLQLPAIQDYAVSKTLSWLSEEIGTEIEFSTVRISGFNRIRFADLLLEDQQGDTIIYSAHSVIVTPVIFSLLINSDRQKSTLKSLEFDEAVFNIAIDTSNTLNFQFIVDYLDQNKNSEKKSKPITIRKIDITNSEFNLTNQTSSPDSIGIDFGNMRLGEFQISARNIVLNGDTVSMDIKPLSFTEKSSFTLEEFKGHLELCKSYLHFTETEITTPYSNLNAESLKFSFDSYADFKPDSLPDKVNLNLKLEQSRLNLYDLGYFADVFLNTSQSINLAGRFYGKLSNLKGRQILLGFGSTSFLSGGFSINGLPDINETFLIFDLSEFVTSANDIENFELPDNKYIKLPSLFTNLTNLRYKGNFTGFLNDFVANGRLTTNLGSIYTDLMFTPDTSKSIRLSGSVKTTNFQLGKLIDKEDLVKEISVDASITGLYSKDQPLIADINGRIDLLNFLEYPYQNINVNGTLSDKRFNGELNVDDPNLSMSFRGLIDMESRIREYDFNVNIIDANLYALNISEADPEYHASFLLRAKAKGSSLDDLNGEFNLLNSLFSKTSKQIQVYDFNLLTKNNENSNEITINSDILDAEISGKYKLSELKRNVLNYFQSYIPALINQDIAIIDSTTSTQIDFDVKFKRTQSFFEFFFPEYLIGENSEAQGSFFPNKSKYLNLTFIAPELKYKTNNWNGFVLNIDSKDSSLLASAGSQNFNLGKNLDLENFTLNAKAYDNRIDFNTRWLNWDSTLHKGAISGNALFEREEEESIMTFNFDPATLTISDTVWSVDHFSLLVDSSGVGIEGLNIAMKNQHIIANGKISDVPGDSMQFSFDNFNLSNLNFILEQKDLNLSGALNGKGKITGKELNPLFFSSLSISDLVFNGVELGNCSINSLWDNRKQSLNINAEAKRGKLTMLKFQGDYFPSDYGKMDFHISLNKLKSNIFNPFLEGVFSDIRGFASGELQLSGFKDKPTLSGKLLLQKNAFTVDYLKTRYNFTTEVEIVNNNFILNNIEMFDKEGNRGTINGMVRTEYLKDINLNLGITINELLCMDIKGTDNDMFFGTAYASGDIRIKGEPTTLRFNINAKTDKNTRLFIPLSQNTEVSSFDYISFIRNDTSNTTVSVEEPIQQVNLTGMQMDFNLDVTPDAEVQIIFDPTMGDIIKARGTGDMQLSINTLGTFDMVGEYAIDKGDYLFTLQNVINKRLSINKGSTLRWTGDPFNANIDVTAIYRTKASLSDLRLQTAVSEDADNLIESTKRTTVDCRLYLTGMLMSPSIKYDIYLPYSEEETRTMVSSQINTDEDLSKQFLSLMVMSRFLPSSGDRGTGGGTDSYIAGMNTASELLSNQLSNYLSQISNDFDLGVNYRPGGELTTREVEVMISSQFFNDRLSIDGSVDMKEQTNAYAKSPNKWGGDFDVDYKLNKRGKIRLRAFSRSNDDITDLSPNTQGFGIFFKEEFNTFGELMDRYWATLSGKRKKTKPEEADVETN